jgi:UDP-N-acetylmuramyl pentapeptide phosphotransferase/UDP-N-acetylglucosamine-1-phosphate transferase
MDKILLGTAIAFIITFAAIPVIIKMSEIKKLFDIPDARKLHSVPISSLGGLGIFAGFILSSLLIIPFANGPEFQYFMASALIIFFLGLKDDILVLTAMKKFIGQVLAAFIIIYKGGVQIKSMHGFLGVNELPEPFSLVLTYFTVIVIINSFNLIDGVDGLASSLGMITSLTFGIYFFLVGQESYGIMAFALAGSLLAFLIFNHSPAKIFMGDTGSLLIGLINAILVIRFINIAETPGSAFAIPAAPAIGFAILVVPLFDTLRVFSIRIFNRRSPFSPDKNHVHHLLLDKGLSHNSVTLILAVVNIAFIAYAYFFRNMGCTFLFFSMAGFAMAGIALLFLTKPSAGMVISSNGNGAELKTSPRSYFFRRRDILEEKN